ncbi:TIGR02206 family membrane protein [Xanthomarina sp. F1114]|uniref:YwaF family protein n=1 Tax=Xanthomarina sp. F1114 TaxID=2996019 RepID=UPI00225E3413|nr:TIGR02206 family membrane protein [Xanthomarina sp. F1114]MCX7548684.1 TIGR02206 family membrane protein [Xanthomarina sp. F1114]
MFLQIEIGGFLHEMPIIIAFILGVSIILFAKKVLNSKQQFGLLLFLSLCLSLFVIGVIVYLLFTNNFDIKTDLPLYLSSFSALIFPIIVFLNKPLLFRIFYFWCLAWGVQAISTPDILDSYLSLEYFRYWIVHLGTIMIVLYGVFVLKIYPNFNSVFLSILALQGYILIILLINEILDSNYMYLSVKPESVTVLDYLGPWPYYILGLQLFLIPYFLLFYLPFYFYNNKANSIS